MESNESLSEIKKEESLEKTVRTDVVAIDYERVEPNLHPSMYENAIEYYNNFLSIAQVGSKLRHPEWLIR